ncbi:DUF732 domain-containing protein [Mycobacterium sp. OTB74]|uniref:DUF732 domain-containing protein n=1 Tax=Mycobacterium sp. OTB74 TaxID=1853452 RepID=UPI0024766723|nr:DUF732 domain-containing protein [Mycobacterium sp. OTB74]MDH6245776.1 hypothetical protein [Mycobacterium sp. OTB74]
MRKARAIAVGGTAAALMLGAAPAHADTTDFINDEHWHGLTNTGGDEGLVRNGWTVCRKLDRGLTPRSVLMQITEQWPHLSGDGVANMAHDAVHDLCPLHSAQAVDEVRPNYGAEY